MDTTYTKEQRIKSIKTQTEQILTELPLENYSKKSIEKFHKELTQLRLSLITEN